MIQNQIFVPTTGTDKKKFEAIPRFTAVTGKALHKLYIDGFRNAGKVKEFVESHTLAYYSFGANFNGYGWEDQTRRYLMLVKDAKTLEAMIQEKKEKTRKSLSEEEKNHKWAKRLAKLTGISQKKALVIMEEKLEDKRRRIEELEDRQYDRYSVRREKLINKLDRENPLRRIKDAYHARCILAAYVRHNYSDYDALLEEAREKAEWGEIGRDEVREFARMNMTSEETVDSVFFGDDEEDDEDVTVTA